MTTTNPPHTPHPSAPTTEGGRGLGAAALILAGRIIQGWGNQKTAVITTWVFPVFVTLLFLGLFGGALQVPDGASYTEFLLPGMLTVTMLFGLESTTLSAAADAARGINDRFRTYPISAAAIVLGRCLADLLSSLIALSVIISFGLAIGWRPDTTVGEALLALALLVLLRFALLWVGIALGYRAASVESVAFVQILVWPIAFLSSVFVDPASMPTWLGLVAELNPVSATATTVRDLLGTVSWPSQVIPSGMSAALAIIWPVGLTVVALPLAARAFRHPQG